jgi:ribosomal protein S18 acetylase RimI-like enzyme
MNDKLEIIEVNGYDYKIQKFISNSMKSRFKTADEMQKKEMQYVLLMLNKDIIGVTAISNKPTYALNYNEEIISYRDKLLNNYSYTEALWVSEEHRNKGYGKILLSKLYQLWKLTNNKYLLREVRETSTLGKSDYYNNLIKLGKFTVEETGRKYKAYLKIKE